MEPFRATTFSPPLPLTPLNFGLTKWCKCEMCTEISYTTKTADLHICTLLYCILLSFEAAVLLNAVSIPSIPYMNQINVEASISIFRSLYLDYPSFLITSFKNLLQKGLPKGAWDHPDNQGGSHVIAFQRHWGETFYSHFYLSDLSAVVLSFFTFIFFLFWNMNQSRNERDIKNIHLTIKVTQISPSNVFIPKNSG